MSEEKKSGKNEEICDGKEELSLKELEMVNSGGATVQVKGEDIAKLNTTEALQGVGGVVVISSYQPSN